jgi:EpsD family peptidyl-prolyl cis-trans isomerase
MNSHPHVPIPVTVVRACLVAGLAVALAGCGDSKKDKPATQTAAKVNKEEITVHQINAVLAQQRGLRPEQADDAARRALERLIDQELAVQKSAELKLDRDPRVVQQLEAARRDIVARAYADKLGEGAPKPSAAEVKKYYDDHPALFGQRRLYQLQEFSIKAEPSQVTALQGKLSAFKNVGEVVNYLKANNLQFTGKQSLLAAEQVPLAVLPELSQLKDGGAILKPSANGANVVFLLASRLQPVDEERAAKAIEQFLHNDRKRKLIADDIKALRAAGKIEYVGTYAASAPLIEPVKAPTAAEVAASAAATLDTKAINEGLGLKTGAKAASAVEAADANVKASSGVDAATISKGLGLK